MAGPEELNVARIRNTLDFLDLKVTALNRGFIMLLNVLQDRNILDENTVNWIDKIKRDSALAKAIDTEKLMGKALESISEIACSENSEEAIKALKNYTPKPKVPKVRLPKL
jgi:hypothetical protein